MNPDSPLFDGTQATVSRTPAAPDMPPSLTENDAANDTGEFAATMLSDVAEKGGPPDEPVEQRTILTGDGNAPVTDDAEATFRTLDGLPERWMASSGRLGRFKLIRILGQGAFGTVHLAHDPHLDRQVAIKVAKTGVLPQKRDIDRFLREARAAAQLRHPHIVPVYEFGQVEGTNYICYQFIRGRTLKHLIAAEKKLTPTVAATIASQLARALHYAHQEGIVHRDMKPDNVLMDEHDAPHIADFGLARREESGDARTIEGSLMGTPAYMSPEQASGMGAHADGRSDVWSLGIMLDEMLTGVRPFEGTITEVLVAVKQQEPRPLRLVDAKLPRDLETIVSKALTKDINTRFQSAELMADELDRWLRGEPILSRPINIWARTGRWIRRHPDIAGLIGIIGVCLLFGVLISSYFAIRASHQAKLLRQEKQQRALGQAVTLQTAEPASVTQLLENLLPDQALVVPELKRLLATSAADSQQRVRAELGLARLSPEDPDIATWITGLHNGLLHADAREHLMLTQNLASLKSTMAPQLWEVASGSENDAEERFRAACTLAHWESDPDRWQPLAANVALMLTERPALELANWIRVVQPAREILLPELERLYANHAAEESPRAAATILAQLYSDRPALLCRWVETAEPRQLALLHPGLTASAEVGDLLAAKLQSAEPTERLAQSQRSAEARRQANLALALLAIHHAEKAWPEIERLNTSDLSAELVRRGKSAGVKPHVYLEALLTEKPAATMAAAFISLGVFSLSEFTGDSREKVTQLVERYRSQSKDPGVRSAAVWLSEQWKLPVAETTSTASAPSSTNASRSWIADPLAGSMLTIRGPVEFQMGSADDELFHAPVEKQHRRQIPRSFAVAMYEVTVADFRRFRPEHEHNADSAPELQCPVNDVTWFDAAQYCRWLSEQAQLPEQEMCYPPVGEIAPGIELSGDLLSRTGYRLPTAAEWEFVCRCGETGSRSLGENLDALDRFAWFERNSQRRSWPVGRLLPNAWGMFDLHGNAMEWCWDWYFDDYPAPNAAGVVVDGVDRRKGIYREIRGGSFQNDPELIRTADRDYDLPLNPSYVISFRVARTLPRELVSEAVTGRE